METIITSSSPNFRLLCKSIKKAVTVLDQLIEEHRPTIFQETYLTGEEIRSLFGLSLRCLQNYRDARQIPYTSIGGKIFYPQFELYKLLESRYVSAEQG